MKRECGIFLRRTNRGHIQQGQGFRVISEGEVELVTIISLNAGLPRLAAYQDQTVETGIFKEPVSGPARLRTLNLDGDRQADLSVHGGPFKAVYAYPSEHYEFWREQLPGVKLPWGMFGENFTTEGISENDLHIGDQLSIGDAVIMVRQPRMPCYKLAFKFRRDDMIARFLHSGRSGFYFSVEQEGTVAAGNSFEFVSREPGAISIAEMNLLYSQDKYNLGFLNKAIASPALPEDWREYLRKRLSGAPAAV